MTVDVEHSPDVAFFITRIDDPDSDVRQRTEHVGKYILEEPLERRGIRLLRADQDPGPQRITEKVVNNILRARLVIVDATGGNPNVFYELGLSHAFRKPVILLIDSTASIPFDVSDYTFIVIGDDGKIGAAEAESASREFGKSLEVVLDEGFVPSSPVATASAVAELEASDDPGEQGLAEVLRKLESLESSLRRVRRLEVRDAGLRFGLDVRRTSQGFTIRDHNGQIFGATDEELKDAAADAAKPADLAGWLQNRLVEDGWDMSDIDSQELRKAVFAIYRFLREGEQQSF